MTEHFDGWLTNLSKYIADLNTKLVKTKAENAELLRELDLTKRMYAKVSEEKCIADSENAMLREMCKSMRCALVGHDDKVYLAALDETLIGAGFDLQELGIEVDA